METFTRHSSDLRHFLKCSAQFTSIYHNGNGNSRCCPAASIFGLLIIGINNFIAPDTWHTTSPLFHFSQFYSLVQSVVEFEICRKFRRMKVIFTIKILQPTDTSCWLRDKWLGGGGGALEVPWGPPSRLCNVIVMVIMPDEIIFIYIIAHQNLPRDWLG